MDRFYRPGSLAVCLLPVATIALLSGFADSAAAQRQAKKQAQISKRLLPPKRGNPIAEEFKPIPSGPGIQVCEPIAIGADAALADFGSGCGFWLQWAMGFQPELGQTPRWEIDERASRELHVPRLRLSLAQGSRLTSILGVTHIAVGQISGTPAKCLLLYQLYAVPAQKAVGAPIKIVGSEEQVVAQLPAAARALLVELGVRASHLPAAVGATPEALTTVGNYRWYDNRKPTAAEQQPIDFLSQKFPLARLLAFVHNTPSGKQEKETAVRVLLEQTPANFLVLGVAATYISAPSEEFARFVDGKMAALNAPNNALTTYWAIERAPTPEERVRAAQHLVRLAPRSSTAWNTLALYYGELQQSIRLGRFFSNISEQEGEKLFKIYSHWVYAASQATTLDPDYQPAWRELATAATFAGDSERADAAFWKAFSLDKSDLDLYFWGLEMYQPKWGGDAQTLAKVARLAATAVFPPNADLYGLGVELQNAGYYADAQGLFARAIVEARDAARRYPNDSGVHTTLGSYLSTQNQRREAEEELTTALRLNPNSQAARHALGTLYQSVKRYPEAIAQFREDVRITGGPNGTLQDSLNAKITLANAMLYNTVDGDYEEPENLLNAVLKIEPKNYSANENLGWLLAHRGQYEAAVTVYSVAAQFQPNDSLPHREMGRMYRFMGKFEEAVREGELAVGLAPKNYDAISALAETYAAKEDFDASVKMYRQAIDLSPNYSPTHFSLAKILLKMGKKEEARAELQRVLALKPTGGMAEFIQLLIDSNQ